MKSFEDNVWGTSVGCDVYSPSGGMTEVAVAEMSCLRQTEPRRIGLSSLMKIDIYLISSLMKMEF